jgi:hypothetical protein
MSLLESGVIPRDHNQFYNDLPSSSKCSDRLADPDAAEETDNEIV